MLVVEMVTKAYGGVVALADVSFAVEQGEVLAVIGPNGAGKTTLFDVITAMTPATRGSIQFDGREIAGARSHAIAQAGMARTFQNLRVFTHMSVVENVAVGSVGRHTAGRWPRTLARLLSSRSGPMRGDARQLLVQVGLGHRLKSDADQLPYAELRRLEIARALATQPSLLILDEPVAGMSHHEAAEVGSLVREIQNSGVTVILIEHNMQFVSSTADRVIVLDKGALIATGTPQEIYDNPQVLEAYVGVL
ncbi:ABC transporter ATP-binding protein [Nocardioides pyridinolyticus]